MCAKAGYPGGYSGCLPIIRTGTAAMPPSKLRFLSSRLPILDTRTARHEPKRADPELLTPEHRAWRQAVMHRAGWRCEAVENGYRCTAAHPVRLFADHIAERKDGGAALDPDNGMALCGAHHARKTQAARAERFKRRT